MDILKMGLRKQSEIFRGLFYSPSRCECCILMHFLTNKLHFFLPCTLRTFSSLLVWKTPPLISPFFPVFSIFEQPARHHLCHKWYFIFCSFISRTSLPCKMLPIDENYLPKMPFLVTQWLFYRKPLDIIQCCCTSSRFFSLELRSRKLSTVLQNSLLQ